MTPITVWELAIAIESDMSNIIADWQTFPNNGVDPKVRIDLTATYWDKERHSRVKRIIKRYDRKITDYDIVAICNGELMVSYYLKPIARNDTYCPFV